jgi:hypothetical protein
LFVLPTWTFVPFCLALMVAPRSWVLPGIPLQLSGLPFLLFFHKTCLTLTMLRPSRRQRPLRSSFAPTVITYNLFLDGLSMWRSALGYYT